MSVLLHLVPDFRGLPRLFWVLIAGTLVNPSFGALIALNGCLRRAPALGGYIMAHAGAGSLWSGCLITGLAVAAGFAALTRNFPGDRGSNRS